NKKSNLQVALFIIHFPSEGLPVIFIPFSNRHVISK
ncbi:MAG: hypothetical protein ACI9ZX_003148, partial [Algoriphagus sp.]